MAFLWAPSCVRTSRKASWHARLRAPGRTLPVHGPFWFSHGISVEDPSGSVQEAVGILIPEKGLLQELG